MLKIIACNACQNLFAPANLIVPSTRRSLAVTWDNDHKAAVNTKKKTERE